MSQNTTIGNVKIGPTTSPTTSSIQGLCMYEIAGRAASQLWLGMGGQGIGVRGVLGSIPAGNHPCWWCQFQKLEREDRENL